MYLSLSLSLAHPTHQFTYQLTAPQRLGLQPVRLAAPWIAFAFAGYLPPEQTLLLWDRVLGFDSLEPLVRVRARVRVNQP